LQKKKLNIKKQIKMQYKFIDLFAGIGGFRKGFEDAGFKCVFTSEINPHCQQVYETNFGEKPFGDITKINPTDIPDFDILLGGFPCQPFSLRRGSSSMMLEEAKALPYFAALLELESGKHVAGLVANAYMLSNFRHSARELSRGQQAQQGDDGFLPDLKHHAVQIGHARAPVIDVLFKHQPLPQLNKHSEQV
jgi:hypothetical protein